MPTTPITSPTNTPSPPQYSYVVKKPKIHVQKPKLKDAPRKPKHEILRVARNNDNGSKTISQTQNAVSAAVQTYHTIFSETQRTPLIQSANKNPKARIAAIPRKTLPATLSAECCPALTESFDGMSFSQGKSPCICLDNWLFCSTLMIVNRQR